MALPHDAAGAGPAVILLHAGIADRGMWAEHLQPLAEAGYRAVAIDLPGFGEAPAAGAVDAPWRDVLATIDQLGIERAVLAGDSFGGAVAQRIAVIAPERVAALVLVSSPAAGLEPSAELRAAWEAEEQALERGDLDGAVQAVLSAWMLPDAPPALRERVAAMQRRALELQLRAGDGVRAEDPLEDDPEALAQVRVPALVLVGERDMVDFHRAADTLARTLQADAPTVLAGAGHLAPLEQPAAFRDVLLAFLGALEAP